MRDVNRICTRTSYVTYLTNETVVVHTEAGGELCRLDCKGGAPDPIYHCRNGEKSNILRQAGEPDVVSGGWGSHSERMREEAGSVTC